MVSKYQTMMNDVYEYIHNRIKIGKHPEDVTNEVVSRYKIEVHFPAEPEIIRDCVFRLCEQAYFYINKTLYKT